MSAAEENSDGVRGQEEEEVEYETPQKPSTLYTVCPYILGNEFCERLAFNGLATNLVMYLTRVMGETNGNAALQVNLFGGTCYLTPLLGAWIADAYWGRYKTIMAFSAVYFVGMVSLALTALVPALTPPSDLYPTFWQNLALFGSLYVVALGTGGIKPNVSAFGADQFDMTDPQDRREKNRFFNAFYFFVNIGSLIAVTLIVWVQENVSWGLGFAIPATAMGLATCCFWGGRSRYTHVPPTESPLARVYNVVRAAIRERRVARAARAAGSLEAGADAGADRAPLLEADSDDEPAPAGAANPGAADATLAPAGAQGPTDGLPPSPTPGLVHSKSFAWLDDAKEARLARGGGRAFSERQVEEVKLVLRLLPIFATTAFYWTVYAQMGSIFVEQGAYMNRRTSLPFGWGQFIIPSASVSLVNTVAVVVLIPLYDAALIPLCRRVGYQMTLLRRIGWGVFVSALAMLAAAALERVRLRAAAEGRFIVADAASGLGKSSWGEVVDVSVWWQIPQYALVGLSEIFTSIGQLEFFYDQAPDVMRSCSMALQLLSVAVGSYLAAFLVAAITSITRLADPKGRGWMPKDLNAGRIDLLFLLLAGLTVVNLLWFLRVSSGFEYKTLDHAPRVAAPVSARRPALPQPTPKRIFAGSGARARALPMPSARRTPPRAPPAAASPAPDPYGRSVTFFPPSPIWPAPRR